MKKKCQIVIDALLRSEKVAVELLKQYVIPKLMINRFLYGKGRNGFRPGMAGNAFPEGDWQHDSGKSRGGCRADHGYSIR